MDGRHFDDLTRAFARRTSRRSFLAGLAAGLTGALTGQGAAATRRVRHANGGACTRVTDCASFHCVDGVCCDSPCIGQCESCATGTCQAVSGAPPAGKPACPGSGPCAAACDGITGATCAAYPGPETPCGPATCAGGWLTTHVCAGNGACAPTTTACAPFGCDATGTACATGCTGDGDCGPGSACVEHACVPVQALGTPCTAPGQCASGVCADGVCCIGDCGACRVCGADGFCAPAPANTACDGGRCCDGACIDVASDVEHCGQCDNRCLGAANGRAICVNGDCAVECLPGFQRCTMDGPCVACCAPTDCPAPTGPCEQAAICTDGVCGFIPADPGTPCGDASCHDGTATLVSACTGDSTVCPPGDTVPCGLYTCDADEIACRTTCENDGDVGCVPGAHCDGGQCLLDADLGTQCDEPGDCTSGFCVDGVCCNTACTAPCAACDRADLGLAGVCSARKAGSLPSGDRAPCPHQGEPCGGYCDGSSFTCAFPDDTTRCQESMCTADRSAVQHAGFCDGAGACVPGEIEDCFGLTACRDGVCLISCEGDGDCVDDAYCQSNFCVPKREHGVACQSNAQCLSGHCVDNFCCATACDGQCERCDLPEHEGTCTVTVGQPCSSDNKCLIDPVCQEDGTCFSGAVPLCEPSGCSTASTCNPDTGKCEPSGSPRPAGTVCGQATHECEQDPVCDGESLECPAQGLPRPGGLGGECLAGPCELSLCNGTDLDCPPSGVPVPAEFNVVCRSSQHPCEAPSICDGEHLDCPSSGIPIPAEDNVVCGIALNACEANPICNGTDLECPDEGEPLASGTRCFDPTQPCDEGAECDGVRLHCTSLVVCCATDDHCDENSRCSGGKCIPRKELGEECDTDHDCLSGHCSPRPPANSIIHSVCCNEACDGDCQHCTFVGQEGTCVTLTGGDPCLPWDDFCSFGTCNAQGECVNRFPRPCAGVGAPCVESAVCNPLTGVCDYVLKSSDALCNPGDSCRSDAYCDGSHGFCPDREPRPEGIECQGTGGAGTCCDGFCCDGDFRDCCGGTCMDVRADENNCGSCGNVCGSCQTCQNGSCVDRTDRAQLGEPCLGTIDPQPPCCPDLTCLYSILGEAFSGTCVPPCKSAGEGCTVDDDRPCCEGLVCNLSNPFGAGTCGAP